MGKYELESARRTAMNCAKSYRDILCNKRFIVIYRDAITNNIEYIEIVFLARNYQHLTGLNLVNEKGEIIENHSEDFFRRCVDNKLKTSEISFRNDGTTTLKIEALPMITKFTSVTKITGESNDKQPFLYVDKLVGGVNVCIGLRKDENEGCYVPVSSLQRDIKELTDNPSQVLAIFEKEYEDNSEYQRIRHVAKGLNLNSIKMPQELKERISLEYYTCPS
ncbi:MAG: hypothetical protein K6B14_03575 [Lachnospiraceae bacterium]|nr:hypothetical protein [Lachnospiraceae bacterium]